MDSRLDPYFEGFFIESLGSYFDLLKERLTLNDSSDIINEVFFRYINCARDQFEEVIKVKDQFLESIENRKLLKIVEENNILPIFYQCFGYDYLQIIDDIINSAINLFFKIALDFSENISKLFLDK